MDPSYSQSTDVSIERHRREIHANIEFLKKKPLLRRIYHSFYEIIRTHLSSANGITLELGSGMGLIKEKIPECICTDIFAHQWVDRVENAYRLSDPKASLSNIILVDVFHHLRYPGEALDEWFQKLVPRGRVIIFEPDISVLGMLVYGLLHPEPVARNERIQWKAPREWDSNTIDYYAAQGNAHRVFHNLDFKEWQKDWDLIQKKRFSYLGYVASGGFSKPQLYPSKCYPAIKAIEKCLDIVPQLFSTRICIVLEKKKA